MCLFLFLLCNSLLMCFGRSLTLQTLAPSFLTNKSSLRQAFLCFIAFSDSPTAAHCDLSSMQRHGHSHKLTSSCALQYRTMGAYLSQTHRPIALHCMHNGLTPWAYFSKPLVKTVTNIYVRWNITMSCAPTRDHILRTCYGEVYKNVAQENGWLSCKFIMLLSFELSSFRENSFSVLLYFPCCSRWYLSLNA